MLGMGSCGSNELWDEAHFNTVAFYTPEADGLHVRMVKYTPKTPAESLADFTLPFA